MNATIINPLANTRRAEREPAKEYIESPKGRTAVTMSFDVAIRPVVSTGWLDLTGFVKVLVGKEDATAAAL